MGTSWVPVRDAVVNSTLRTERSSRNRGCQQIRTTHRIRCDVPVTQTPRRRTAGAHSKRACESLFPDPRHRGRARGARTHGQLAARPECHWIVRRHCRPTYRDGGSGPPIEPSESWQRRGGPRELLAIAATTSSPWSAACLLLVPIAPVLRPTPVA